jgi:lysophospholipase L1-like esterase
MAASFPSLYAEAAELSRQRGVPIAIVRYAALAQLPAPADPALAARYEELLRTERTARVAAEDIDRAARDEYASALGVIDVAAPAAGLPVLDVATRMFQREGGAAGGARWLDLFRDRMHLTPAGNAAVADALAALLQEHRLLPAR